MIGTVHSFFSQKGQNFQKRMTPNFKEYVLSSDFADVFILDFIYLAFANYILEKCIANLYHNLHYHTATSKFLIFI